MQATPRYPYVAVDVAPSDTDAATEALFELGALGLEERDGTTLVRGAAQRVTLVASFEDHEAAQAALRELPASWAPRLEEVVGDAWRDEWKKHFEPFRVCEGVVVRPPWCVARVAREHEVSSPAERVIELEPGRAFGTGLHETTSLVAEVLAANPEALRDRTVLDVGAGSGILSLVALTLGARSAVAIDVDADAVEVTRENAARNGLTDRVDASTTAIEALPGEFPVVLANIEARTLVDIAPALVPRVARGGLLVLSGILAPHAVQSPPSQQEDVARAYRTLHAVEVRTKGEWIAMVFRA
jgi:ribosomal protein L11 methyltransferase